MATNFGTCHASTQNIVAIILLQQGWDQNEISIKLELQWETISEMDHSTTLDTLRTDEKGFHVVGIQMFVFWLKSHWGLFHLTVT